MWTFWSHVQFMLGNDLNQQAPLIFTWERKCSLQGRFLRLRCKTVLEANDKGWTSSYRYGGSSKKNKKSEKYKEKYEDESNLSSLPPAPTVDPDLGSVPLHSGRPSGKSHCPPSPDPCLWGPEAAYTPPCALWRAGKCQSLHRCRSPSPVSAGGCRPACPRWRCTRDRRLHAFLGSHCVPAGSWCRLDCRWTLDDSVSSFSSCWSGKDTFEFTKPVNDNYGQTLKKKHSPNYHANHNQHDDKNDQQDGHHAQDDAQETVYSQQK